MDANDAPSRPVRTFRRSTTDRDLGGVAGGLAARLDVDPAVVRLALVAGATALAFGSGDGAHLLVVVPYALAWALVPTDSGRSLVGRLGDRAAAQELALIVVLVVVAAVAAEQPGALVVAALGALAALLLRDRPPATGATAPDGPPAHPSGTTATGLVEHGPDGVDGTEAGLTDAGVDDRPATGRPSASRLLASVGLLPARLDRPRHRPAPRARPARARREPALWPLGAALLAVLAIGTIALDPLLDGRVDPRIVVDLALLAVGAVLVLSAWRGRARLLLVTLPVLLPLWFATSVADIGRFDGTGVRTHRPTGVPSSGTLAYELGFGRLEVDLTDLPLASGSTTRVELGTTAGLVEVRVPADAVLRLDGHVGLGSVGITAWNGWQATPAWLADGRPQRQYGPQFPYCFADQEVRASELRTLALDSGLPVDDDVSDGAEPGPDGVVHAPEAVLDAVEEAGYPRPTVLRREPAYDDGYGSTSPATDVLSTHRSDAGLLCHPVAADPDPPVVVLDTTLGLGHLEVTRV